MRMLPARKFNAKPMQVKRQVADIKHFTAPLKGLSLSSKLTTGDPLTAPILSNWVLDEDKISSRPGTFKVFSDPGGFPVETIVPFYGFPSAKVAATNGKLVHMTGLLLKGGFASNDWSWTSFVNLGTQTYTLMANGLDGVWSWDGAGACVKEALTFTGMAWFNQNRIQIVMTHQNRVWFADRDNLTVYYLPVQQKSGNVKQIPVNQLFKRGGTIRAMYTWSIDGGAGMDDRLVIFSSNNECAIYQGSDPDDVNGNFGLVGVYRFDSPMSKHSVVQYGGDLYVLISTGLVPMSTMLRAEGEKLGKSDQNVVTLFTELSTPYRGRNGWSVQLDYSTGRMICNLPQGAPNRYRQLVRKMPTNYFVEWADVPARCWQWLDDQMFFGDDKGNIFEMHPRYLSDNNLPIHVDIQFAWSNFKTPALKQFKMIRPYILTDGEPTPYVDIRTDYDTSPPFNRPDLAFTVEGAEWDIAPWDTSNWAAGVRSVVRWNGVAGRGSVGAARIAADLIGTQFSVSGVDVVFESGSIMG